jgi:hypothetical protein
VRRKDKILFRQAQGLQHLGHVAMVEDPVGAEVLVDLRKVQPVARRTAGARRPGFAISDNSVPMSTIAASGAARAIVDTW